MERKGDRFCASYSSYETLQEKASAELGKDPGRLIGNHREDPQRPEGQMQGDEERLNASGT